MIESNSVHHLGIMSYLAEILIQRLRGLSVKLEDLSYSLRIAHSHFHIFSVMVEGRASFEYNIIILGEIFFEGSRGVSMKNWTF